MGLGLPDIFKGRNKQEHPNSSHSLDGIHGGIRMALIMLMVSMAACGGKKDTPHALGIQLNDPDKHRQLLCTTEILRYNLEDPTAAIDWIRAQCSDVIAETEVMPHTMDGSNARVKQYRDELLQSVNVPPASVRVIRTGRIPEVQGRVDTRDLLELYYAQERSNRLLANQAPQFEIPGTTN